MSLIQQALEKTSRVQETRTGNPVRDSKVYQRDPMGAALEQELTQIQQSYARKRKLYWKVSLSLLGICLVSLLSYVGVRQIPSGVKSSSMSIQAPKVASTAMPVAVPVPIPLKIYSGSIYRLTGITNANGKSMALINGAIVSVGDVLPGNATVKAIGQGEVVLDVQGRELKLTL